MLEKFYKNRNSFDLFRTHLTSNLERGHQINIGDNNDLKKSEPSLWLIVFFVASRNSEKCQPDSCSENTEPVRVTSLFK